MWKPVITQPNLHHNCFYVFASKCIAVSQEMLNWVTICKQDQNSCLVKTSNKQLMYEKWKELNFSFFCTVIYWNLCRFWNCCLPKYGTDCLAFLCWRLNRKLLDESDEWHHLDSVIIFLWNDPWGGALQTAKWYNYTLLFIRPNHSIQTKSLIPIFHILFSHCLFLALMMQLKPNLNHFNFNLSPSSQRKK